MRILHVHSKLRNPPPNPIKPDESPFRTPKDKHTASRFVLVILSHDLWCHPAGAMLILACLSSCWLGTLLDLCTSAATCDLVHFSICAPQLQHVTCATLLLGRGGRNCTPMPQKKCTEKYDKTSASRTSTYSHSRNAKQQNCGLTRCPRDQDLMSCRHLSSFEVLLHF